VAYATKGEKLVQKSQEQEDLRVRRTRKLLQKALIELTVEKGFAAVTIQDISERAMVNRSTVYRHYPGGKYDLLEQYTNEVTAFKIDDQAATNQSEPRWQDPPPILVNLLKHIEMFADFYRVMLGQNGDKAFTERFRKNHEERFRILMSRFGVNTDANSPPIELSLNYLSYAMVGAIIWWLENDQPCSVEQLALWLVRLSRATMGVAPPPGGMVNS
jgi:AcrR family transcriptional regulator